MCERSEALKSNASTQTHGRTEPRAATHFVAVAAVACTLGLAPALVSHMLAFTIEAIDNQARCTEKGKRDSAPHTYDP